MRTLAMVRAGAKSGAIGAVVMILGQAFARLGAGVPMFPDLFEDALTRVISLPTFGAILDTLKFQARPVLFVSILLLQIVIGAVIGIVFGLAWGRSVVAIRRPWIGWSGGLIGACALWVLTTAVLLPLAGKGFLGLQSSVDPFGLNLGLILNFLLFGLTVAGSYRVLAISESTEEPSMSPERRRLLG